MLNRMALVLASARAFLSRKMLVRRKQYLFKPLCEARGIRSEATVSTNDLKTKLDRMEEITVVETFAPERYREATHARSFEHSARTG